MPVLDASFLIDAQAGVAVAKTTMKALMGQRLLVPYQAALEFVSGFQERIPALRALRDDFELVMPDDDQLLQAAALFRDATTKGRRLSWSDIHVAALAKVQDDILVTADVKAMQGLGVRLWDYRRSPERPSDSDIA